MAAISLLAGWYQQPPYYYESFNGSLMLGCAKGQRAAHGNGGGTCNGGGYAYPNPNQLLLLATLRHKDGSVTRLSSGTGLDHTGACAAPGECWTAGVGPITFNCKNWQVLSRFACTRVADLNTLQRSTTASTTTHRSATPTAGPRPATPSTRQTGRTQRVCRPPPTLW